MRLSACICVAALSGLGVFAFASDASAQDPANTPAAAPAAPGTPAPALPRESEDDEGRPMKKLGLELNPLGFAIGRYSLNVEYMLARHHALILTPFFDSTPVKVNDVDLGSLTGFGGELGYRFYTGDRGMNGFFIGPSVLFASWSQSLPDGVPANTPKPDGFTAIGGALDLGGQAVIGPGVIVGAGFGLQYTKNSIDIKTDGLNIASAAIAGGGVRPRFLLSVGYGF
jgi:hypothetical protein